MLLKKIRFAYTVSTIVLINTLTLLGFITFNFTVIQLNSPSFDLIVNCTRGTANFSSDGTQRTMIFQTSLNNNRSEEHTSELQSRFDLVCRLLLEKKKITMRNRL